MTTGVIAKCEHCNAILSRAWGVCAVCNQPAMPHVDSEMVTDTPAPVSEDRNDVSGAHHWYAELTPQELLDGLHSLGITLRRHGADDLVLEDPQHALTHRLREAVKRRKAELVAALV